MSPRAILPSTNPAGPPSAEPSEVKPRGANRSTKVAGKLKVLPDQPHPKSGPVPVTEEGATAGGTGQTGEGKVAKKIPAGETGHPIAADATGSEAGKEAVQATIDEGGTGDRDGDDEQSATELAEDTVGDELDELDGEEEEPDEDEEALKDLRMRQISRIPQGSARRDALRLTKKKARSLPRVTAYATAGSYRLAELTRFLRARRQAYHTDPRIIDETVLYTPYVCELGAGTGVATGAGTGTGHVSAMGTTAQMETASATRSVDKTGRVVFHTGDLLGVPELCFPASEEHPGVTGLSLPPPSICSSVNLTTTIVTGDTDDKKANKSGKQVRKRKRGLDAFSVGQDEAEVFVFSYGTVVIWGMDEAQERRFLASIRRFEVDRLAPEDVEMEDLNYYYANYSRIYNDVITLRKGSGYMTKLSLSHALSQSVKISLFEALISFQIEDTKDIPEILSETGKIGMPHKEIMRKTGELFILRTNINSVGSVLDSPEVFWSFPDLKPLYEAARSYLETPQRIDLLNTRLEVLQDMLQLLKESSSSRHAERLEQIVIALIGIEIVLGIITILVDLMA